MNRQLVFDALVNVLVQHERDADDEALLAAMHNIKGLEENEWPFELRRIANQFGLVLDASSLEPGPGA